MECAFLAVLQGQIAAERQFRFTEDEEVFAAEVYATKETIANAHHQGLSELIVYSDTRS